MPRCEGPGDDNPCPDNSNNVEWSTSDQWLCTKCTDVRFHERTVRSLRSNSTGNLSATNGAPSGNATIISDPILSYIAYCMLRSTKQKIVKAVAGYYSSDAINDAKNNLWSSIVDSTTYLGSKPNRRGSQNKPVSEYHVEDIIDAINKVENEKKIPVPRFVVDAPDLKFIPKAVPEEMMSISVCERLNSLEAKYEQMQLNMDSIVAENLSIQEEMLQIKSLSPKSFAAVTKGGSDNRNSYSEQTVPHETFNTGKSSTMSKSMSSTNNSDWRGRGRSRGRVPGRGKGHGRGRGHGNEQGYNSTYNSAITHSLSRDREHSADSRRSNQMPFHSYISEGDNGSSRASSRTRSQCSEPPFEYQYHERRRQRKMNNQKICTGEGAGSDQFSGAPEPSRDLFIYRFLGGATEDSIKRNVTGAGYEVRAIQQMSHTDAKFKSFRLSVPSSQYETLRDDTKFWPRGVRIKRFVPKSH